MSQRQAQSVHTSNNIVLQWRLDVISMLSQPECCCAGSGSESRSVSGDGSGSGSASTSRTTSARTSSRSASFSGMPSPFAHCCCLYYIGCGLAFCSLLLPSATWAVAAAFSDMGCGPQCCLCCVGLNPVCFCLLGVDIVHMNICCPLYALKSCFALTLHHI
jgi:hypothetical protein